MINTNWWMRRMKTCRCCVKCVCIDSRILLWLETMMFYYHCLLVTSKGNTYTPTHQHTNTRASIAFCSIIIVSIAINPLIPNEFRKLWIWLISLYLISVMIFCMLQKSLTTWDCLPPDSDCNLIDWGFTVWPRVHL